MPRYIDADAWNEFYIERTKDLESYNHYDMGYGDAMDQVDDWLDAQPTIEARPVARGAWVLNKDGSGTCKQCGWTAKDVWDEDGWQNFCGQCVADMRGEEDG